MELNKNMTMPAYTDDVVILRNSRQKIGHTVKKLIAPSRKMGLIINKAKTKYMLMIRNTPAKNNLIVGPYNSEQVDDFYLGLGYLGVNINYKNDMHNEVKLKIKLELGERFIVHNI